jgi:hypothetical protein
MDCNSITKGLVGAVCGTPEVPGTGKKVILITYNDIDRSLSVVTNNVISDLVLKATKKGYAFESLADSAMGEATLGKETYFSTFAHAVSLKVFTKSEDAKAFVNQLAGARVVAIVENRAIGTDGEVKYEVYGWGAGLELSEAVGTTDMADRVVYSLKLTSNDKSKEGTLPLSLFDTDEATTDAIIASLIA